ncbi:MAG: fibronectin type III domain-containing protein [Bacteroidota bacterium]
MAHSKQLLILYGYIFSIVLISLLSFSCTEPVDFNNPFDPNSTVILGTPLNLQIVSMTDTTVTLQWENNFNLLSQEVINAVKIVVEYSTNYYQNYSAIDTLEANKTTAIVKRKFILNEYNCFYIYALAGSKRSMSSGVVYPIFIPPAPSNLEFKSFTSAKVELKWTYNSSIEADFAIELSTDGIHFFEIASAGMNNTTAIINYTFDPTEVYYFRVYAYTFIRQSSYSNIISQQPSRM